MSRKFGALLVGIFFGATVLHALAAEKPFDPGRKPAADLQAAETKAKAEHKNILMDVGGNWCPWCLLLDRTLETDSSLHTQLDGNYVVLRVNWSRENKNEEFLSAYPKPKGFPAWYVLSPDGKLLEAEDTSNLESNHSLDSGYNKELLAKFLDANAPRK